MMHKLTVFFKPYLAKTIEMYRIKLHLTQAEMAEVLAVSSRYYYDIKYEISMISVPELILFLNLLTDNEKLDLFHDMERLLQKAAYEAYLDKIDFI